MSATVECPDCRGRKGNRDCPLCKGSGQVEFRLTTSGAGGSKYNNIQVKIDGYTLDSIAEAERYKDLKLEERAGMISDLKVHPRFPLYAPEFDNNRPMPAAKGFEVMHVAQVRIVSYYEADFTYYRQQPGGKVFVIEDVKGMQTDLYLLKRKWLALQSHLAITEIDPYPQR